MAYHESGISMQVTETSSEGLKREFTIVVPAADLETEMQGRLAELARSVRIPGFRPGKAPVDLLRKRYGDSVRGEVLEKTIQETTANTISENGIRPAMQPRIEIVGFAEGADLEYKLALELVPDIEPVDFSRLELERQVVEVDAEEVEAALGRFAEARKSYEPPAETRPARSGDRATIRFVGRIDGEEFEGGSADDFVLDLGSDRFVPGFEEKLIGVKPGDSVEFEIDFPDDYPQETLKGRTAVFAVDLKELREPQPAVVGDELAKSMGFDGEGALRSAFREQIEGEYAELSRSRLKRALLDRLSDAHDFPVPEGLVAQEFEAIWERFKEAKEENRLDEDDKGRSDEELEARYRKIAERRVRLGLLIAEVGQANDISVSGDDTDRALADRARWFPGQERQIADYFSKNPEALRELQAPILEDKVVDFILAMAQVTDRIVPARELREDEAAEAGPAGEG